MAATLTANYSLKKPAQADEYDVDDFNGNMDTVDTALKNISDSIDSLSAVASSGSYGDLINTPTYNDLDDKPFRCCDTAAKLSSAVSVLQNAGNEGGVIFLMPGVYEYSENLTIWNDNITLIGSGESTVLKFGAGSKLHVRGNNTRLRDLTIKREEAVTLSSGDTLNGDLILLNSETTHTASGFRMEGVTVSCPKESAPNGLICITSSSARNVLISGCVINSDCDKLIYNSVGADIIVTGCMASGVTVPRLVTLGVNIGISSEGE